MSHIADTLGQDTAGRLSDKLDAMSVLARIEGAAIGARVGREAALSDARSAGRFSPFLRPLAS